jgi:hypothetical protein
MLQEPRTASRFRRFAGTSAASILVLAIASAICWWCGCETKLVVEIPDEYDGWPATLELTRASFCLERDDAKVEYFFDHPGRYELHIKPGDYDARIRSSGFRDGLGHDQSLVKPRPKKYPISCVSAHKYLRLFPGDSVVLNIEEVHRWYTVRSEP